MTNKRTLLETISAGEAAKVLGVTRQTISNWARAGRIPGAEKVTVHDYSIWIIPLDSLDKIDKPKNGRPFKQEPETV